MKTNVMRRAAVAVGGVVAVVTIATSAVALGSGTTERPVAATDARVPTAPTETAAPEPKPCAEDGVPHLTVERHPDATTRGAATVLEAVQEIVPTVQTSADLVQTPFGSSKGAPVWVEAAGGTYVVEPAPAGGWYASAASWDGCTALPTLPLPD